MDFSASCNRTVEHLLDYVANGKTDQAAETMTVPVEAYLDPDQWQREMDLIFKRLPIFAGLSHELPNPRDFKTIEILGKPLIISRQTDGSLRAMYNVCTHRGMLLTTEAQGNCSRFSCPYHGWTFGNDGRLIGVAEGQKFGPVDKESHGLTQLPVWERAGFIFVVLTPGLEVNFEEFFGGMADELDRFNFPNWYYCGQRVIQGANWKVAYDGYLEGYHFAAAHPETINQRTYSNVMHFEAYGPHLRIGFPQRGIDEKLRNVPPEEWWKHENNGYDFVRTLFPNVSIFVAPEFTQIAQLLPGPTPNRNTTILYYVRSSPPADDVDKQKLIETVDWLRDVVDEEDYQLGLKVQRGLESGGIKEVVFGRNERGNQYFHKWVNYYLANDPSAPKPVL